MEKVKFLYNPDSGDNRIVYMLNNVISIYQEYGYVIVPHILTFNKKDDEFLSDEPEKYHHVLIAGGDGTINYVVNILKDNDINTPIAVLPTGTANDFAKLLNIPSDIDTACRKILSGEFRDVDLGQANGRYFVNVFSSGLFTDISQKTPTIMKNTFGKLAYYFSSLGELPNFRKIHLRVTADGKEIYDGSSLIFFVFNGKTAGNLRLAYLSDIEDGLLDILIVRAENINGAIKTVFHYMSRNTRRKYPKDIIHVQGKEIEITSQDAETTDIDGQPGPSFPVRMTCHEKSLKILCPKK